jgi:hypothetical protein
MCAHSRLAVWPGWTRIKQQRRFGYGDDLAIVMDEIDRPFAHHMQLTRDTVFGELIGVAKRAVIEKTGIE